MVDFVPVEHDPFNDPPIAPALGPAPSDPSATGAGSAALQLVPVDHDPFSTPTDPIPAGPDPFPLGPTAKPGQTIPKQNVLGDLNAITARAGKYLAPNLAAFLTPIDRTSGPLPEQGKVPSNPNTSESAVG